MRLEEKLEVGRKLEMMKANSVNSSILKVQFLFFLICFSLYTVHPNSTPHKKSATLGEGQ